MSRCLPVGPWRLRRGSARGGGSGEEQSLGGVARGHAICGHGPGRLEPGWPVGRVRLLERVDLVVSEVQAERGDSFAGLLCDRFSRDRSRLVLWPPAVKGRIIKSWLDHGRRMVPPAGRSGAEPRRGLVAALSSHECSGDAASPDRAQRRGVEAFGGSFAVSRRGTSVGICAPASACPLESVSTAVREPWPALPRRPASQKS
jgi:hypothetical protein